MWLQHRPSAFARTARLMDPHLWASVVLGLTTVAGVARGQEARRAKGAIDARQAVRIAERFVRERLHRLYTGRPTPPCPRVNRVLPRHPRLAQRTT